MPYSVAIERSRRVCVDRNGGGEADPVGEAVEASGGVEGEEPRGPARHDEPVHGQSGHEDRRPRDRDVVLTVRGELHASVEHDEGLLVVEVAVQRAVVAGVALVVEHGEHVVARVAVEPGLHECAQEPDSGLGVCIGDHDGSLLKICHLVGSSPDHRLTCCSARRG
jgi:hypothetical protein